jgi:hypothetical protein
MIRIKKGIFTNEKAKIFSEHLKKKFLNKGFSQNDYLKEKYSEFFRQTSGRISDKFYQRLKRNFLETHKSIKENNEIFENKLNEIWGEPLRLYAILLFFVSEIIIAYFEDGREDSKNEKGKDFKFQALIRINFRACRTGNEILALLEKGYADGADARWRTLHELAVTALFIHKNDDDLAERYLLHANIESFQAMRARQKYSVRNKSEPFTEPSMANAEKIYNDLLARYGANYKKDYGWAAKILGVQKPDFTDIERNVELDHARPNVKMSNHLVHSSAKGVFFSLGLPESKTILFTGASNLGLAPPGVNASISLMQTCYALLASKPFPQNEIVIQILEIFIDEIRIAFTKVSLSIGDN